MSPILNNVIGLQFALTTALTAVMTSAEMPTVAKLTQYCDFETFEAACSAGHEVVVMQTASYGRRETGRCLSPDSVIESLQDDPQYFGCSADVLRLADRKCSGRPRCSVAIPDVDFERVTPCYKDSRKYLEAKYDCVRVVEADRSCVVQVSTSAVHISSSQWQTMASTGGCGSTDQPWTVRAPTGQHIRLHLIDFTADLMSETTGLQQQHHHHRNDDDDGENECREYGYVEETSTSSSSSSSSSGATRRRQTVICGDQQRDKLVIKSTSNLLHIVVNRQLANSTNFLLRFYAVGCLDVRPPDDAWMRRIGSDMVEIGCYMSRQVWVLRCVDNQFVGVIGNCTQYRNAEVRMKAVQDKSEVNGNVHVLGLVAVSAAGLAVCLTVVCVGILCIRSQKLVDSDTGKSSAKYRRRLMDDFIATGNVIDVPASKTSNYNIPTAGDAVNTALFNPAASQHHV